MNSKTSKLYKVFLFVAVISVVSPIDIIPDFAVGIGQLDDLIGILMLVRELWVKLQPLVLKLSNNEEQ